ncbi:hypothetical protein [Epilithonimonas xixisoli]|uniref:hypothetical protein n=1 Tax=Epilithonimonas xixisoli TaxID=1476462 RepID=UPI001416F0E7|nr:hypothetical protein [Epilithonimonas xixisoli]
MTQTYRSYGASLSMIFERYKQVAPLELLFNSIIFLHTYRSFGALNLMYFFNYKRFVPLELFL